MKRDGCFFLSLGQLVSDIRGNPIQKDRISLDGVFFNFRLKYLGLVQIEVTHRQGSN